MPETTEEQVIEAPAEEQAPPSEEMKKTEKKVEHMLPKARFDEVNEKLRSAEKELKKLRDAEENRKRSEMTELERLKLEKTDAEERAGKAANEARDLRMQIAFEDAAEELNVTFFSKQAAKDAYKFLDPEILGEDGAGMSKALEALKAERPYLFSETITEEPVTDARQKGTRRNVPDKDREEELKSRFRIRTPR